MSGSQEQTIVDLLIEEEALDWEVKNNEVIVKIEGETFRAPVRAVIETLLDMYLDQF